jgi:solute carrier family 25 carnitine/acylcarnitine transporter 20/29
MDNFVSFSSGMVYGFASTLTGQPLDTIKTRMQARPESLKTSPLKVGTDLFKKEGIRGLYRGGMPLFIGGGLIRSAQFGFYESAIRWQRDNLAPAQRVFGIDPQVVAAGFCGGFGRGLMEGPFDFAKTRRQMGDRPWRWGEVYQGSGVTMFRNSFLFMFFAVYTDLAKQVRGA